MPPRKRPEKSDATKRWAKTLGRDTTSLKPSERKKIKEQADFIALARKRYKQGEEYEKDQHDQEIEDLRFAGGDQWPAEIKTMRAGQAAGNGLPAVPAKPCLTINNMLEPLNQLKADAEDSDLGFELVPADDFGELVGPIDETEITLREGLARRILRESEASEAALWGFDRGIKCGRGYWGVMTRYAEGKTNDQDIFVQRIYNQNSVMLDPSHEEPDGSDAEWGFTGNDISWDQYEDEYPEAADGTPNPILDTNASDFRSLGDEFKGWFTEDKETRFVRVVDYYYTVRETRKLVTLTDGSVEWEDELDDDDAEVDPEIPPRTVVEKKIKWAKIDGLQVLEETDWPSPYVPIVKYVSQELQPYDEHHRYQGLVRPAIDSARAKNYMVSQWVWQIGLAPVPQIMMAGGQDEGWETEYNAMNTRSIPVLHYNQTDFSGRPAPPPFDPPRNTNVQAIAGSIALFDQAIQSTTQSHSPSHGQSDPALRSSKAIDSVVANDRHGNSGDIANLARSWKHTGRIVNSLLYPIYGMRPGRIARILDGAGNQSTVMIGKHFTMQGADKMQRPVAAPNQDAPPAGAQKFTLTENAKFNVVVKVTKNYETRRQEEAAMLGQIISAEPGPGMATFGDLFFKNQDGPGHDELAERAKVMLDPKVQAALQAKDQGLDIPAPVQQQMIALQKSNQEKDGIIKQAQQVIATDQIKADNEIKKLQLKYEYDLEVVKAQSAAKIESARITAAKQPEDASAEAQEELVATGIQQAQEEFSAEADHKRELETMLAQHVLDTKASQQEHGQAMAEGQQQHQQTLAEGQQANANAMQQNQQQAALQPPPQPAGAPADAE